MADEAPLTFYQRRMADGRTQVRRLDGQDVVFAWARGLVFLAAIVVAAVAVRAQGAAGWRWLAIPGGVFAMLAIGHDRVLRARARLHAELALDQAGIERCTDQWAGKGDGGAIFQRAAEEHLYANDLDLYGAGGLFELLSVARTPVGRTTLASWLEAPAAPSVARARQGAVSELAALVDLRRALALVAVRVGEDVREEALIAWAGRASAGLPTSLRAWRWGLAAIGFFTPVALVAWADGHLSPWPALIAFTLGVGLSRQLQGAIRNIFAGVDRRADELGILSALMSQLERRQFESPALRALVAGLQTDGITPSRRIAQLRRLVDLAEGRRNQMAAILMGMVQASAQLALAIEDWRRVTGAAVVRWMAAVGEVEALASLAAFHFEHPALPFPTLGDDPRPVFDAEGLGHPLIPAARRVTNDLQLGGARQLILVSGSNMSGKSTLLRTVGVNVVLALAGAPVCARRLTVSGLALGATLRINDSLQEGKSRFYAELTRLKRIVDRAGGSPQLLFLLDEILHGTNSHDRRLGAEALLRGLIARGAVGLVTTHDLALAQMADALGDRAANVHFEDHLENGLMTFDYRMKPGVVRKSNALELMRAVGLEV